MAGSACSRPGTRRLPVEVLNREIANALASPELQARLLQLNLAKAPRKTPAQFGDTVRADLKTWTKIVQDHNIRAEE